MRILSLFDGMACGMLALQKAGVSVSRYVAFEIDKYAVKTSSHNFPMIEHRGDVFQADFTGFDGFDGLVGGSPCTYWSIAQKNNRETEASGMGWELFSQYVRALRQAKPKWFIYENNKSMSAAIRESITSTFGFEPICINSALVSAQNRQRLYWVGKRNEDGTYSKVDVKQPEDRGILLRDILETGAPLSQNEKSYCLTTRCNGAIPEDTLTKNRHEMVAEKLPAQVLNVNPSGKGINGTVIHTNGKSRCLTTNKGEGQKIIEPVGIGYRGRMEDGKWVKRYESNGEPKANAITTAQTDSMVGEPIRIGCYPSPDGTLKNSQGMRLYSVDGKSVNITAQGGGMGAKTGLHACPVMSVNEATKRGYAEIAPGDCVDMTQPNSKTRRGRSMKEKSNCLMTSCQYYQYCGTVNQPIYEVKDGMITIKGKQYPIKLVDGFYIIRKLTVRECMRLQTVPEWYEFPVSNSQAYKMLGNGWTVDVIAHILLEVFIGKD